MKGGTKSSESLVTYKGNIIIISGLDMAEPKINRQKICA